MSFLSLIASEYNHHLRALKFSKEDPGRAYAANFLGDASIYNCCAVKKCIALHRKTASFLHSLLFAVYIKMEAECEATSVEEKPLSRYGIVRENWLTPTAEFLARKS